MLEDRFLRNPSATSPCKILFAHPTFVSVCTHESLSNLSCAGWLYHVAAETDVLAIQSNSRAITTAEECEAALIFTNHITDILTGGLFTH